MESIFQSLENKFHALENEFQTLENRITVGESFFPIGRESFFCVETENFIRQVVAIAILVAVSNLEANECETQCIDTENKRNRSLGCRGLQ